MPTDLTSNEPTDSVVVASHDAALTPPRPLPARAYGQQLKVRALLIRRPTLPLLAEDGRREVLPLAASMYAAHVRRPDASEGEARDMDWPRNPYTTANIQDPDEVTDLTPEPEHESGPAAEAHDGAPPPVAHSTEPLEAVIPDPEPAPQAAPAPSPQSNAAAFYVAAMARPVTAIEAPVATPHLRAVTAGDADHRDHDAAMRGAQEPSWRDTLIRWARLAGLAFAGWFAAMVFLLAVYRFVDPPISALMLQKRIMGLPAEQTWVPIEDISDNVVRAVLVSEDGRFCDHAGVDFVEIQNAIERGGKGPPRGASTISMQVIKNLFLWPSKSYIRKAIEVPLTYIMELFWPKWRVMEVYLNIAEWGPGIFGIEQAAQHHFKKSAAKLSASEAAKLAVSLPNPFRRNAGRPGPQTRRLATVIQSRMRQVGASETACVRIDRTAKTPSKGKN